MYLILKKIHDTSESSLETLKTRVSGLKISSLQGEDVETAVSFVRSVHDALLAASTAYHNYIPDDFPRTVLKVFQTSSVPVFNKQFEDEETEIIRISDKTGLHPVWPDVDATLNLAANTYTRLKTNEEWNLPRAPQALVVITCWNCGKGHTL